MKGKNVLEKMMKEVYSKTPSTVTRANVSGKQKDKMERGKL